MASLINAEFSGQEAPQIAIPAAELVALVRLIESNSITRAQAREALREAVRTGKPVDEVVKAKGLSALLDEQAIAGLIGRVLAARPEALGEARKDKKAFNFLVGQVLREEPKAQPSLVAKLLAKRIAGTRASGSPSAPDSQKT